MIYGADDAKGGAVRTCSRCSRSELNHRVAFTSGILADDPLLLLQSFVLGGDARTARKIQALTRRAQRSQRRIRRRLDFKSEVLVSRRIRSLRLRRLLQGHLARFAPSPSSSFQARAVVVDQRGPTD